MDITDRYNCKQARRLLHERLDGALPTEANPPLEAHLAGCPACAAQATRLEAAVSLLRAAGPAVAPADLPRRIMAAAGSVAAAPLPRRSFVPQLATACALAALALIISFSLRTSPAQRSAPASTPSVIAEAPVVPAPALQPETATAPRVAVQPPVASPAFVPVTQNYRRVSSSHSRPAPIYASVPQTGAAMSEASGRAEVSDAARGPVPITLAMAEQRVAVAPTANYAAGEGAFTDEVVGQLVAGAMLVNYMDGAPPGLRVTPAGVGGPQ